jgi:hypothetical protein
MFRQFSAIMTAMAVLALSACESMQPATYANLADNTFALRNLSGTKVSVSKLDDKSNFDPGCRLVGPVQTSGARTIAKFIQDSFNDELKFAGIYSAEPNSVTLVATLQSAAFSSSSGLTEGWWNFSLELANPKNGRTIVANNKYEFHSGFAANVACANASQALTPAVQKLINKAITDPGFPALIGNTPAKVSVLER